MKIVYRHPKFILDEFTNKTRFPASSSEEEVSRRILDFYENVENDLFAEKPSNGNVVGFYNHDNPRIIGLIAFDHENFHFDRDFDMLPNYWNYPGSTPVTNIAMPGWMRNFRIKVCVLQPDVFSPSKIAKLEMNALKAVYAAAVSLLEGDRAWFNSWRDTSVAIKDVPAAHKRALLDFLFLSLFDPHADDYIGGVVNVSDAVDEAQDNGKVIFYANKLYLDHEDVVSKMKYIYYTKRGIVLILDYSSTTLQSIFSSIVAIDGCLIIPLTPKTDVKGLFFAQPRRDYKESPRTRLEENEVFNRELSWTLGYAYAEHQLDREDFEEAFAAALECSLCMAQKSPRHNEHHKRQLFYQASTYAPATTLQIRHDVEFERGITWFHKKNNKKSHDDAVFLFNSYYERKKIEAEAGIESLSSASE